MFKNSCCETERKGDMKGKLDKERIRRSKRHHTLFCKRILLLRRRSLLSWPLTLWVEKTVDHRNFSLLNWLVCRLRRASRGPSRARSSDKRCGSVGDAVAEGFSWCLHRHRWKTHSLGSKLVEALSKTQSLDLCVLCVTWSLRLQAKSSILVAIRLRKL